MTGLEKRNGRNRAIPAVGEYLPGEAYLAFSFLGLHFSQTLPSALAFTQHLCSQSLPAAFAFSQQVSARTAAMLPRSTRAQMMALMDFMYLPFLPPYLGQRLFVCFIHRKHPSDSASMSGGSTGADYSSPRQIDNTDLTAGLTPRFHSVMDARTASFIHFDSLRGKAHPFNC